MQLLDNYGQSQDLDCEPSDVSSWIDRIQTEKTIYEGSQYNKRGQTLTLCFSISNHHPFYRVSSLKIEPRTGVISIKITLMENNILRSRSSSQKTTIIRYFLQQNSKRDTQWKINTISGEIYVTRFLFLDNIISLTSQQLNVLIIEAISILMEEMDRNLVKILHLLNRTTLQEIPDIEYNFLTDLKTCVQTSGFYGWKMLESTRKSKASYNKQNIKIVKHQFIKKVLDSTESEVVRRLSLAYKPRRSIESYEAPSNDQDQALKEKYLTQTALIVRGSCQLQTIQLDERHMDLLRRYSQITIRLNTMKEPIQLYIERYDSSMAASLEYEAMILRALPAREFIGIARHYYCQNLPQELKNIRLTNLSGCRKLPRFMSTNKSTMSVSTKLSLLYQISVSLKYIRDSSIVFHGLQPNSIFIKKNMVKLNNFTNSYINPQLIGLISDNHFFNLYKDKYPFIINSFQQEAQSHGEEKSDVFSLGMMIFQILFGDLPFRLSRKTMMSLSDVRLKRIYSHAAVMCPEKFEPEGYKLKMLLYTALKATNIDNMEKTKSQSGEDCLAVEPLTYMGGRPYLDWMVILLKKSFSFNLRLE